MSRSVADMIWFVMLNFSILRGLFMVSSLLWADVTLDCVELQKPGKLDQVHIPLKFLHFFVQNCSFPVFKLSLQQRWRLTKGARKFVETWNVHSFNSSFFGNFF